MLQHTLAKLSRIAPSRTEPRSLSGHEPTVPTVTGTAVPVPVPVPRRCRSRYRVPGRSVVGTVRWRHIPGTAGQNTVFVRSLHVKDQSVSRRLSRNDVFETWHIGCAVAASHAELFMHHGIPLQ